MHAKNQKNKKKRTLKYLNSKTKLNIKKVANKK